MCGNIQLCAGIKDRIEGATHALGQRRLALMRKRRQATEEEESAEAEKRRIERRDRGLSA